MKNRFENTLEQTPIDQVHASQKFLLFVENLSNIQGVLNHNEYESSGHGGEIKVDTDPNHEKLMLVKADTGALVSSGRELATERLSGCVALFIQGPNINYLVHLTPSSNIGYYYYRYSNPEELTKASVQKVMEPLIEVVDPNTCHGILVVNEGNNNGGAYDNSNLSQAWLRFREQLIEAGLKDVVIADSLPLDETTIYYGPEEPALLFAVGTHVSHQDTTPGQTQKKQMKISIESGKAESF